MIKITQKGPRPLRFPDGQDIPVKLTKEQIRVYIDTIDKIIRLRADSPTKKVYYRPGRYVQNHRDAFLGQVAFGNGLELWPYWELELNGDRGNDVCGCEVRQTGYKDGRLKVTKEDFPHMPYILVTGSSPYFILRGWIFGWQAQKLHQHYGTIRGEEEEEPNFWLPQEALRKEWNYLYCMARYGPGKKS